MKKRLVICCDGTWNTYDDPSPTNVFKLRNLILPEINGTVQAVYYDQGVGTSGGWLKRAVDGATGWGLSENVRQAYRAIIDNYENGDEIYLFGFSRGAFTVRSLAGLIRNCGILRRERRDLVKKAYALYRMGGKKNSPNAERPKTFRRKHAVADVTRIRFVGVWDTVGALGNPLFRHSLVNRALRFHDVKLSSTVDFAYQALAIDEHRKQFLPSIWEQQEHSEDQVLEQVWFIGAHSDVGGGYDRAELSNIALNWMVDKAKEAGLAFDEELLRNLQRGNGSAAYLPMAHDSHRGFYTLFPPRNRIIGRPRETGSGLPTNERLHWTVMARYRRDLGYRPENVVDYLRSHPLLVNGEPRVNHLLAGP